MYKQERLIKKKKMAASKRQQSQISLFRNYYEAYSDLLRFDDNYARCTGKVCVFMQQLQCLSFYYVDI